MADIDTIARYKNTEFINEKCLDSLKTTTPFFSQELGWTRRMGILDVNHLRVNRIFVSKHVPKVAKTADRINRLAQFIGEIPAGGLTGAKCIGMGFIEISNFYAKQAQKSAVKKFDVYFSRVTKKVEDLKDSVSKEDQEFVDSLEKVDPHYKDLQDQEVGGMQELKNDNQIIQAQITEMENMIIDLHHVPGCKTIRGQYKALMDAVNVEDWSYSFPNYKNEFEASRFDFEMSNLTKFFLKIFKNQCTKSWEPLYRAFIYIWEARAMYFFIKCTYILNLPKAAPSIDIEKGLKHELELLDKDFKIAEDSIQTVCFGFFKSLMTSSGSKEIQREAFMDDLEWRQTTEYKFLPDISFWNQGWTNDFKRFVSNGEQSMKFCVSIEHYENLTKQESILDIKNQFPVLLSQLEDDMKDFSKEVLCIRFAQLFNEKCQNNLDPLYEDYCKIKRCRLMYFDVKLNYIAHIHSTSIDIKKKGDEEKKILEKDIKTVDKAIQSILDDSLVDLKEDVLCTRFMTTYKEKCQNSWDPVLQEYTKLKSIRPIYMELKPTFTGKIDESKKESKERVEKEMMKKDMKTLDIAIKKFLDEGLKDEGLSDFNVKILYTNFMKVFKENCQESWNPLFEEYRQIKSRRSIYLKFKLAIIEHIYSSDKDIKKKGDEEKKLHEKDIKTVDTAIQKCVEDGMKDEGLKDFHEDFFTASFMEILKEKCQNSLDPLYEECCRIRSLRSLYSDFKLNIIELDFSSDKDIKEKCDEEKKLYEKDLKTVDNAIQKCIENGMKDEGLKDVREDIFYKSFRKILKEQCQHSWDPLFEEYRLIKSRRSMFLNFNLKIIELNLSSDKDIKEKGDEEKKLYEKDIDNVDTAIQNCMEDGRKEEGIKDFNEDFFYSSFEKIFKEKCQHSWDPLFEEYKRIKSRRSKYLELKLTFINLIHSSPKDIKEKGDEEKKLLEKDMKTVDTAIQKYIEDVMKDKGLKEFNQDFFYNSFEKILKEKCQHNWDPLFQEYQRIKSLRSMYLDLKLKIIELNFSSDKDIKEKGDEEKKLFEKDLKNVDMAIQKCIENGMKDEGLKDVKEDIFYNSFKKIFKEKCQNSWEPLFEEYKRIKSHRSKYLELKQTFITLIHSSPKDIKERGDEEKKLLEKDMKTVDTAIQKCIDSGMKDEGLKDFNEDIFYSSFKKIFKENCQDSWEPLFKEYQRIKIRRSMYLNFKLNIIDFNFSSDKDIKEKGDEEKKLFEKDMKIVDKAIQSVCSGFFFAALNVKADWSNKLGLKYIPDFNEIEKTESNFYKTSTFGETIFGNKSGNKAKVNLYRKSQEPFVLVHSIEKNIEYIHKMNEDGLLQDGIHRCKWPEGDTCIGCRLFRRGDRQEDKEYRLYNFSSSGQIKYIEQVWGKEEKSWRTITDYKFHPDPPSWSNLKKDT